MRRRRSHGASESLDLLLDTLCNTFGGVLFIAVLVVLMIRPASEAMSEAEADALEAIDPVGGLEAMRDDFRTLTAEAEALRAATRSQEILLRSAGSGVSAEQLEELDRLGEDLDGAIRDGEWLVAEAADAVAEALENARQLDEIDARLAELREARDRLAAEAEQIRKARAAAPNPGSGVLERTSKKSVAVMLRYDRMYVWHRYGPDGERLGLNEDDFMILERTDEGLKTVPKRTAGIAIDDPEACRKIAERLSKFPASEWYLDVILHLDTFDTFQDFRRMTGAIGYQCRVLMKSDAGPVYDRGGDDPRVQ